MRGVSGEGVEGWHAARKIIPIRRSLFMVLLLPASPIGKLSRDLVCWNSYYEFTNDAALCKTQLPGTLFQAV
jgi:hypothetical protein